MLKKKNAAKPAGLVNTFSSVAMPLSVENATPPSAGDVLEDYKPFIIDG